MLKFVRRVELRSADGVALRYVHAEEARRMVRDGEARRKSRGVITVARCAAGHQRKDPTALTVRHYMGKPMHFRQELKEPDASDTVVTVAYVVTLKDIPNCDRWAYVLSQTDFMAPFRAEYSRA